MLWLIRLRYGYDLSDKPTFGEPTSVVASPNEILEPSLALGRKLENEFREDLVRTRRLSTLDVPLSSLKFCIGKGC